ncbi:MAG: DegQ family serine endoprotease [Bdellovibrionota bacterium]
MNTPRPLRQRLAALGTAIAFLSIWTTSAVPAAAQGRKRDAAAAMEAAGMVNFADLAESLRKTVVNIRISQKIPGTGGQLFFNGQPIDPNDPNIPDIFRHFFGDFGMQPPQERQGQGSGVIISPDGYIATNHHVVAGATTIKVVLLDETEYDGKVIGSDPKMDLALVKIEPKGKLEAANWGDSEAARVGDWAMAIGNPFGLTETVTVGIISAKGRIIGAGPYDDFIQTDASINPGNSGGPLFNTKGEVIGINTAISARGQGIGFAIPSNPARKILDQLKKSGSVIRGWLGVGIQQLTPELAESLGLPDTKGVIVSQVFEDSPAQKAGFEPQDVIVDYDGKPIRSVNDLPRLVADTPVGTKVKISVLRDGKRKTLDPVIAQQEGEEVAQAEGEQNPEWKGEQDNPLEKYGLRAQTLTPQMAREQRVAVKRGAFVTEIQRGGPADRAGLEPGDVIVEANRRGLSSARDLEQVIRLAKNGQVVIRFVRGDQYFFAVLKP